MRKNKCKVLSIVVISCTMLFSLVGCSSNKVVFTKNGVKYTQSDLNKEASANKKLEQVLLKEKQQNKQ